VRARSLRHTAAVLALAVPLALVASIVLGLGAPTAAVAATPSVSGPLNVLPSTVKGGYSHLDYQMAFLYRAAKTPEFWQAVEAQKAGKATPSQLDVIDKGVNANGTVATKAGRLAKGAGVAGSFLTSAAVGFEVGKLGSAAFGMDVQGGLCTPTFNDGGLVAAITGTDCSGILGADPLFNPNADVVAGVTMDTYTNASGSARVDYRGEIVRAFTARPGGVTSYYPLICFKQTRLGGNKQVPGNPYPDQISAVTRNKTTGQYSIDSFGSEHQGGSNSAENTYCGPLLGAPESYVSPSGVAGGDAYNTSAARAQAVLDNTELLCVGGNFVTRNCTDTSGSPVSIPKKQSADPDRQWRCDTTYTNGSKSSATSATFRESGSKFPDLPMVPNVLGLVADTMSCSMVTPDGSAPEVKVREEQTTPEYKRERQEYPECEGMTCQLELYKGEKACHTDVAACADWATDPNKSDSYRCRYGPYPVALDECSVYGPTFTPEAQRVGLQLGNPTTGAPQPNMTPNRVPGKDAQNFGTPVQDPASSRECFPSGWGVFNPLEWVQRPVMCALEWAFVPKPSAILANTQKIDGALGTSGLGTLMRNATQLGAIPIPGNGCGGIPLKFDLGGSKGVNVDTHLLNACPGTTLAPVAAVAHTILAGLIVTLSFLSILRYVATIFGFSGLGGIQQQFAMSEKRAEQAAKGAGS